MIAHTLALLPQPDNVIDFPQKKSILHSSQSNDWYTPSVYIEAARQVMGGVIDLDPASCAEANFVVRANAFYTQKDTGLDKAWHGCIWLNPPYGTTNNRSNSALWIRKLLEEYESGRVTQAIVLVNANPDTRWFHQLFSFPVCFTEGRINFYRPTHKTDTAFSRPGKALGHTHGSAFAYLGTHETRFIAAFSQFGTIVRRVSQPKRAITPLSLWEGV